MIDGLDRSREPDIVLLYDEPLRPGHCALRLAGYSGSRVPWGVRFGGPEKCRFFKDLRLQPVPGGRGYRLDLADEDLLTLGLRPGARTGPLRPVLPAAGAGAALPAQAVGRDSGLPTPPTSPATGRNWPPTRGGPAGRPSVCWNTCAATTSACLSIRWPGSATTGNRPWRYSPTWHDSPGGRFSDCGTCPTISSVSRTRRSSTSATDAGSRVAKPSPRLPPHADSSPVAHLFP